ncbi:MAG: GNAT family N-acetyltransferase [Clostridia bacterium]|nr:GNAT family N-acetyltransferase [Clostridia bacterium]
MIYESKPITLKDGTAAIFRSPSENDAQAMIEYLHTTCKETHFLTREPEEALIPLESEIQFLRNISDSANDLMIACEINGKIIGNCNISRNSSARTKHRASVGIAIFKEYWGLGIATAMFNELIRIAKEIGIKQLELEVIDGNDRAIHLYERFGFTAVGNKPNAFCLKDGTMLNELSMIKVL